jgi:glycosyltransferase involved in cell wall biosynthesis
MMQSAAAQRNGAGTQPLPLVSVVLPVYGQADHIEQVVQEFDAALRTLAIRYEFVLVVNGSADESLARCEALAAKHEAVRVLHTPLTGWGRAVKIGLAASQGDILCYTNSARTTARELALILLHAVLDPHVVVKATRKIRDSGRRRIGSLLYNLECRALFDLAGWDVNGTPKAFPRQFTRLLNLERSDDLIDLEFAIVCREEGYPVMEAPIFSTLRRGGRSTTTLGTAWRLYWGAFDLWRKRPRQSRG